MNNSGVHIKYGNIAPGAKEGFEPTTADSVFDTLYQLQEYNLYFPNYANPCELYQTVLDGTANVIPSLRGINDTNIGFWSVQVSDNRGDFTEPPQLSFEAQELYNAPALTLYFDTQKNIYATHIKVEWLRDEELLEEQEYFIDKPVFVCAHQVEAFNRLYLTFFSMNMPQNRLRMTAIDFGVGIEIDAESIKNVRLIQEIDPISSEIRINTVDFTVMMNNEVGELFQEKQPISVYFNGELKATTFVKEARRKSKVLWDVKTEDYIGLLEDAPYPGGMYEQASVRTVLLDIFETAKVPFALDAHFNNEVISGYIPYTNCRDALMQVVFAIQAVVDTSNSDVVRIYALQDDIKQSVPFNRILQGQEFETNEIVTGVEVTAHSFAKVTEPIKVYDALQSGVGEKIFVKFSEPLHDISIINGRAYAMATNYALFDAYEGCEVWGKKYQHTTVTKRKDNPLKLARDTEKVVAVENAMLISVENLDNVLNSCYNYYANTTPTTRVKIVEGKHISGGKRITYGTAKYGAFKYAGKTDIVITRDEAVNVGDVIETATEYLGNIKGRVFRQKFNLNGGIIVKECEMR